MAYQLVTGDTGSALRVNCADMETDAAIDVTTSTVRLRWEGSSGIVTRTMAKVDAVNGVVQYRFTAGEIEAPLMKFEVEIEDQAGLKITNPILIEVEVREEIG